MHISGAGTSPTCHLVRAGRVKNTEYKVNGSDTHQHLGAKSLWGLACCQFLPSSVPQANLHLLCNHFISIALAQSTHQENVEKIRTFPWRYQRTSLEATQSFTVALPDLILRKQISVVSPTFWPKPKTPEQTPKHFACLSSALHDSTTFIYKISCCF